MKLRVPFAFLVAAACLARVSAATDYPIQLSRPKTVGLKCQVTSQLTERQERTLTVGTRTQKKSQTNSVELVATAEVLEVETRGRATRASYRIEKCRRSSNGEETEMIPKDSVVIAAAGDRTTVFTYDDGRALPEETATALGALISMYTGGADDDEIFGTPSRRKAGDSWPINAGAFKRNLEYMQPELKLDSISGTARLKQAKTIDGVECLEIAGELRMRPVPKEPPSGVKISPSEVTGHFSGFFPVDLQKQPVTGMQEMTMKSVLTGKVAPGQPEGRGEVVSYRKVEHRFNYIYESN
jgi:hypothetical protein